MSEATRAVYEAGAEAWDRTRGRGLSERPWLERFLRLAPEGPILDLTGILINSSNVGMSKIAFDIGGEERPFPVDIIPRLTDPARLEHLAAS